MKLADILQKKENLASSWTYQTPSEDRHDTRQEW
jgi:hypothetical protein